MKQTFFTFIQFQELYFVNWVCFILYSINNINGELFLLTSRRIMSSIETSPQLFIHIRAVTTEIFIAKPIASASLTKSIDT